MKTEHDPAGPGVVVAVVGPTATGKSDLALDLAERLSVPGAPAEIVNADAYQLYRGMDVGTAKVLVAERRGVRHHLLDVLDPAEDASVARYQTEARRVLDEIAARGARAVVVGGSGLYVRALLDDMRFPGTDPAVRARVQGGGALPELALLIDAERVDLRHEDSLQASGLWRPDRRIPKGALPTAGAIWTAHVGAS